MAAAPFAAIEQCIADACTALLANAIVNAGGADFAARFSIADRDAFDAVSVGDYTLRYLTADAPDLVRGEVIMVDGTDYTVAAQPARLNAHESTVALTRAD
ncbi:MAG: hypothetical protein H3C27_15570 [Opitutaceae bacterium]|nr:hypothetical protein [Opitutaceae bacterium]